MCGGELRPEGCVRLRGRSSGARERDDMGACFDGVRSATANVRVCGNRCVTATGRLDGPVGVGG